MAIPAELNLQHLPQHVAIIMDGNGRWAKEQGKLRVFGHQNGVKAVKDTVEGAVELGLKYLTLYAFSTENWNRPQQEVNALMELLVKTITKETATLMKHQIRLNAIGDLTSLPKACYQELMEAMQKTSVNTRCTLTLALSYSSRWELTEALKLVATKVKQGELSLEDISEQVLSNHLTTAGLPDPELMIRTSGELRLSNFMMWQLAYTELYFTPKLWPDFRRSDLHEAILDFQKRERRFGKITE
ncbi:MAG: isoprenyl transferase [Sphingobacteriaceae bacterium]